MNRNRRASIQTETRHTAGWAVSDATGDGAPAEEELEQLHSTSIVIPSSPIEKRHQAEQDVSDSMRWGYWSLFGE